MKLFFNNYKGNPSKKVDKFTRYCYKSNLNQMKILLDNIKSHKKKKVTFYGGPISYRKAMHEQLRMNSHNKGFWSMTKVVKE